MHRGRCRGEAHALEEEKICKKVDQSQERGGDVRGEHADNDRERRYRKNACRCCEIAEVFESFVLKRFD
jgi:hypothetical protein